MGHESAPDHVYYTRKVMSSTAQPKVLQRLITRTLILMFVLAIVIGAYQWAQQQKGDFDLAPADSAGYIAAVEYKESGQQAVAFAPDGKKIANLGWKDGITDRDLAWQPDGNRLFFVSDRAATAGSDVRTFNIFRWDAVRNSEPSQRTVGTRGRSNIFFSAESVDDNRTALITSGGFVLEFDSKDRATRQVLPPVGREVVRTDEEGSGVSGQFSAMYQMLGGGGTDSQISFRVAKWCGGKDFVAAVLRGEEGETLILQDLRPDEKGSVPEPKPIMAGERVEFAVDPKTGNVVFAVLGFRWISPQMIPPQFKQGNKVTTPFRHVLGFADPREAGFKVIAASTDDEASFTSPAISPSGERVAVVIGPFKDGSVESQSIALMPIAEGAVRARAELVTGPVYEPSWSPNGETLAYVRRKDGQRAIFAINADGSGERQVSSEGEYAFPIFSPQLKTK